MNQPVNSSSSSDELNQSTILTEPSPTTSTDQENQLNPLTSLLTPSEVSSLADVGTSIEQLSSLAKTISLAEREISPTHSEPTSEDKLSHQAEGSLPETQPSMEDQLGELLIEYQPGGAPMEDKLKSESERKQPPNHTTLENDSKLITQAESLEGFEIMSGPEAFLTVGDELPPQAAHSNTEPQPETRTPTPSMEAEPGLIDQEANSIASAQSFPHQPESLSEVQPPTPAKPNPVQSSTQAETSSEVELSAQVEIFSQVEIPAQAEISSQVELLTQVDSPTQKNQPSVQETLGAKPPAQPQSPTEDWPSVAVEPFSEADLLAEPEVSTQDQLLIETEPLYEIDALDELESPADYLAITPVDPPAVNHELNEEQPSTDLKSTAIKKSIKTPIEHQPMLLYDNQSTSKKPLSQNFIRPPTNSSKLTRIASNGQLSKGKGVSSNLSTSHITSLRSNPLSIRPNPPHSISSKTISPRPKIPNSIHQTNASITSKSSPAKPPSSSVRLSDKTVKSSNTFTDVLVKSVQPSSTTKPPHSSTITPKKSIPKLKTTPSKSSTTPSKSSAIASKSSATASKSSATASKSLTTASKTASKSSLITPSKPTPSSNPSKPRSINCSTPRSLSRAFSSPNNSQPTADRETTTAPNFDNGLSVEPSPKTSVKSSQAFREMLAKAKRSRPKPPTAPSSPDPNSVPGLLSVADQTEALDPWGFQPIEKVVEKAQKTGKLNVASRMLSKVPAEVYAKLLSHTSIFHPSNRASNTSDPKQSADVDLKFSFDDGERVTSSVAWYETVDLIHLNMSLNEVAELDNEFGGFEALTNCDLHCNQLTGLPSTFGLLTNLTLLDLSSNQLCHFPIPILSLVNLKELNLSKNKLTRLWPLDWKPTLKKQLANVVKPSPTRDKFLGGDHSFNSMDESFNSTDQPSIITESSFSRDDFCDQFPSSPSKSYPHKSDRSLMAEGVASERTQAQPFPSLQKLKLSGNKFTTRSLFGPDSVQFPRNVQELDLSQNLLGDSIEVSNHLRNLQKLTTLNLCGCGLSDKIFWFDIEGDYDQLENDDKELFGHLTELDLSHNAIDSLEFLESFFDQHCPRQPRLTYEGLPRELVKVLIHHGQGAGDVRVLIGNNFLREEARRRRKVQMITAQSTPNPIEPTDTAPVAVVETKNPSMEHEESISSVEAITEERAGRALSSSSKVIVTAPNSTQTMLLKHHSLKTSSLDMSSLKLTELSEDPKDYDGPALQIDVELVNLSHNQLNKFPSGIMSQFSTTLTVLNLSRNRLSNSSSDTFDTHIYSMMGIKLPELVELNLASNFLSGSPEPIIRLVIEGFEAFKLKNLDLSLNQFDSLDGLYALLKLHRIIDHASDYATKAHFRLEKLLLDGNRISQIDDLVRISTEIFESISISSKPKSGGMTAEDVQDNVQFNFLEVIGLSDNSIGQLPPCLGYLPTKRLAVARNLFRFPLRKVYDCVGGDVNILSWLRDRS